MLGRFDPAFLDVPQEVIQLTARVNQKYFVCHDSTGKLANAFVCTANIDAHDGGAAIVAGNEKVLAARLSDAKFFWEQDLKVKLDDQATKLAQITFHEKLGSVADKVERVARLAEWLVTEGIVTGCSAADAKRAAELCKADLVTGMVGEFPELQGLMGGYYARAQGETNAVADAVRDHYKPVGQGDEVPTAPVTVAVSLADKLDTIGAFFFEGEFPTGSKDPYALRRAALAILSLITENKLRMTLGFAVVQPICSLAMQKVARWVITKFDNYEEFDEMVDDFKADLLTEDRIKSLILRPSQGTANVVLDFFADRLKVQQREAGVRHDLIDAVFSLGGEDDLVRLLARVNALQAYITTAEGANLLAAYKRAANILKAADGVDAAAPAPADLVGEERALLTALDTAAPNAAAAVDAEDFEGAMAALASLRAPIDAFFEGVMVNDEDPAKRAFRLGLLARFRDAVHRVADFARIEG
jgi:glycyl-tRNA synthetase beta chain